MPWKECSAMSQREEFVLLASQEGANRALLCRRFAISRKTGYKWLERFRQEGTAGLGERSRRPCESPGRTDVAMEAQVVALRHQHRAWGGRKIARRLLDLGEEQVPAPSTITEILRRHELLDPAASEQRQAPHRFEHAHPNDLWQLDFKGHFPLVSTGLGHPLTVLDDHSRYALVLAACGDQRFETVQAQLTGAFRRYGLPRRILCDNGSPWGTSGACGEAPGEAWTRLGLWFLRLGIGLTHGRVYHPQTQGKDERFHGTLVAEVLRWQQFHDLAEAQRAFDPWREIYNGQRPHEALGMAVPASRYRPSPRSYPEPLPAVAYGASDVVRKVSGNSGIIFQGKRYAIGRAFRGEWVALRATPIDGIWDVYYCQEHIGQLDPGAGQKMIRRAADPLAALAGPQPAG
jgi:transposase InsO family protein